ncbi:ComEA family DNA-binding protein [Photobacterium kishitanii]|uniref:ComEA family DNA-binding protein n=1 Tax=Photobacterium kishitanii TaxID=318456 RepID=UPI003B973A67
MKMTVKYQLFKAIVVAGTLVLTPAVYANSDQHKGIDIIVNINDANAEQLDNLLVGIGPDKAENIIQYRTKYGKFVSVDDLAKVKGIGASTVDKNRNRIKL